jgi:hypothetical protein
VSLGSVSGWLALMFIPPGRRDAVAAGWNPGRCGDQA